MKFVAGLKNKHEERKKMRPAVKLFLDLNYCRGRGKNYSICKNLKSTLAETTFHAKSTQDKVLTGSIISAQCT